VCKLTQKVLKDKLHEFI